jgi:hypothetical protein
MRNRVALDGTAHPARQAYSIQACIRKNHDGALVLATAREGCIAETLLALDLAMKVDRAAADADADDVSNVLMRKTMIITLEGRHSLLSWRSIHSQGVQCDSVKREVLET